MPTSAGSLVFTGNRVQPFFAPQDARVIMVSFPAGAAIYPAGTVLGEIAASPGVFAPWIHANADGSQVPKCILMNGVSVDANGNITFVDVTTTSPGTAPTTGDQGQLRNIAPAYVTGIFKTEDLNIWVDATHVINALTAQCIADAPTWQLIQGTAASGILNIG